MPYFTIRLVADAKVFSEMTVTANSLKEAQQTAIRAARYDDADWSNLEVDHDTVSVAD